MKLQNETAQMLEVFNIYHSVRSIDDTLPVILFLNIKRFYFSIVATKDGENRTGGCSDLYIVLRQIACLI